MLDKYQKAWSIVTRHAGAWVIYFLLLVPLPWIAVESALIYEARRERLLEIAGEEGLTALPGAKQLSER